MDLTGPFQTTTDTECKYILVAKCALTQHIVIVPLKDKSAEEVTKALINNVYAQFGPVDVLVSDNGREFDNKLSSAVHYLIGQRHTFISAYVSRANGMVENQNRTLKDMLGIYCNENQRDWDTYLPVIAHQYNTTINSATGFFPFMALYGRRGKASI